jgi:hypothetical protein
VCRVLLRLCLFITFSLAPLSHAGLSPKPPPLELIGALAHDVLREAEEEVESGEHVDATKLGALKWDPPSPSLPPGILLLPSPSSPRDPSPRA